MAETNGKIQRYLVDLEPEWTNSVHSLDHPNGPQGDNGGRRFGTAFWCLCPCGLCDTHILIPLANPVDGGPVDPRGAWGNINFRWRRQGNDFQSLSVSPSINIVGHWHGWITNGVVEEA